MPLSIEELKNKTYEQLKEAMINGLVKKDISEEQAGESARYISFHLSAVESPEELTLFLEDLSNRWNIYKNVSLDIKTTQSQQEDLAKLQEVKKELGSLKQ
jgi:hypothetical protein